MHAVAKAIQTRLIGNAGIPVPVTVSNCRIVSVLGVQFGDEIGEFLFEIEMPSLSHVTVGMSRGTIRVGVYAIRYRDDWDDRDEVFSRLESITTSLDAVLYGQFMGATLVECLMPTTATVNPPELPPNVIGTVRAYSFAWLAVNVVPGGVSLPGGGSVSNNGTITGGGSGGGGA